MKAAAKKKKDDKCKSNYTNIQFLAYTLSPFLNLILPLSNVLFDRKIDLVTAGLRTALSKHLRYEVCHDNTLAICDYIISLKTEINLSDNYRRTTIGVLAKLSKFYNQKPFKDITREDILNFLDNIRKPEAWFC